MELLNYQKEMDVFYSKISDFIFKNDSLVKEIDAKSHIFDSINIDEELKKMLFFDWYIFDCISDVCATDPLSWFLKSTDLDETAHCLYDGFRKNVYSLFEVKALRTGKEFLLLDLLNDKEYTVKDKSFSQSAQKKQVVVMRILPFYDYYIASGIGHLFSLGSSLLIKLSLMSEGYPGNNNQRLNPLQLCQLFLVEQKKEQVSAKDEFLVVCRKCGVKTSSVKSILVQMKEKVEYNGDPNSVIQDLIKNVHSSDEDNVHELVRVCMNLWNELIEEFDPGSKKGPIEETLLRVGMRYVQSIVDPSKFKDIKRASAKATKLNNEWLNSPKEEFGGKTPKEVILAERKKLGITQTEVEYTAIFNEAPCLSESDKKLEHLFVTGMECLKKKDCDGAIRKYEEFCSLDDTNYVVWNNLGIAYLQSSLRYNLSKAKKCFKRSLEINPDYEFPKKNMDIINSTKKKRKIRRVNEEGKEKN